MRLSNTKKTMSRTASAAIPVNSQPQSFYSTSLSEPPKARRRYSVAARLCERMSSSAVAEELLSSFQDFAPESRRYRRSMPDIFDPVPSKDLLTVSPTTTISMFDHSPLRNRLICTSLTGMDTDAEVFSENSEHLDSNKNSERRSSTKKQPRSCDDDSNSSSTASSIFCNRKRLHKSSTVGKRLKTTDSSRFLCVEKQREESISSAGELERFFDSMGLEDQRLQNQKLQIQVSDDAMEEESDGEGQEEALESVSVMGEIKLTNSVDTDDDEEADSPRQAVTLGGRKDVVTMKKTPSVDNTRIYEWLVNCRPVNEK